jgi:hypothetical protein
MTLTSRAREAVDAVGAFARPDRRLVAAPHDDEAAVPGRDRGELPRDVHRARARAPGHA